MYGCQVWLAKLNTVTRYLVSGTLLVATPVNSTLGLPCYPKATLVGDTLISSTLKLHLLMVPYGCPVSSTLMLRLVVT